MKKMMKKMVVMVIAVAMLMNLTAATRTYAASVSDFFPILAYPLVGNATTYHLLTGEKCGYAAASDQCKIMRVYDEDEIIIIYPLDSGGTRTARAKISDFFMDCDLNELCTVKPGKNVLVYSDVNCTNVIGETYVEDNIAIVNASEEKETTQIIYEVTGSNAYKMGFIDGIWDKETGLEKIELEEGYYMIQSATNPDYVADVYQGSQENEANIQLYRNHYAFNEVFTILKYRGGVVIYCYHSGKVWDNEKNNGNIIQYEFHGDTNQIFDAYQAPDGAIYLKCRSNGQFVDVAGNIMQDEQNIGTVPFNGTTAQQFYLQPVTIDGEAYQGDIDLGEEEDDVSENASLDKREEIVNCALSYVGVGDYRGNNDVVFNTWYWGRQINGSGFAWCQAFISYIGNECGVLNDSIPRTASCATAVQWYKNKNQFHLSRYYGGDYEPQVGDIVFYGRNGSEHVGLIIGETVDGYLNVIEGNVYNSATRNYEVTIFTRNYRRRIDHSYVYGYASPDYR